MSDDGCFTRAHSIKTTPVRDGSSNGRVARPESSKGVVVPDFSLLTTSIAEPLDVPTDVTAPFISRIDSCTIHCRTTAKTVAGLCEAGNFTPSNAHDRCHTLRRQGCAPWQR